MRRHLIFAAALTALVCAGVSVPVSPVEAASSAGRCPKASPAPGSAERKAILDALRPRIESMTGKRVEFVVRRLDTACGFARAIVEPREKGGQGDQYETIDAFFTKRNGAWRLGMIASAEEDSPPAADQYRSRWPSAPAALLYL